MPDGSLATLLLNARVVLVDFDGPLCDVFAGRPAADIARELMDLSGLYIDTGDPLEVLRRAHLTGHPAAGEVEAALDAAEVDAVGSSVACAAGVELVRAIAAAGRPVAVVSNNHAAAIERFADAHDLMPTLSLIVGRAPGRPGLMKPHPWPLRWALTRLTASPGDAVFIGDTTTDLDAARAADIACIAVANKPGKREAFEILCPAAVVDDVADLLHVYRECERMAGES